MVWMEWNASVLVWVVKRGGCLHVPVAKEDYPIFQRGKGGHLQDQNEQETPQEIHYGLPSCRVCVQ
jgi:E3 ubiquitin-protein ligase DOA10